MQFPPSYVQVRSLLSSPGKLLILEQAEAPKGKRSDLSYRIVTLGKYLACPSLVGIIFLVGLVIQDEPCGPPQGPSLLSFLLNSWEGGSDCVSGSSTGQFLATAAHLDTAFPEEPAKSKVQVNMMSCHIKTNYKLWEIL